MIVQRATGRIRQSLFEGQHKRITEDGRGEVTLLVARNKQTLGIARVAPSSGAGLQ